MGKAQVELAAAAIAVAKIEPNAPIRGISRMQTAPESSPAVWFDRAMSFTALLAPRWWSWMTCPPERLIGSGRHRSPERPPNLVLQCTLRGPSPMNDLHRSGSMPLLGPSRAQARVLADHSHTGSTRRPIRRMRSGCSSARFSLGRLTADPRPTRHSRGLGHTGGADAHRHPHTAAVVR